MGIRTWLDSFFSPALLRYLGADLPQRGVISFEGTGVSVADDPANGATKVTIGPTATTPTASGFPRIVNGVMQAIASAVNLASSDVTGTLKAGNGGTGINAGQIASNPSKALVSKADGTGFDLVSVLDLSTGSLGQYLGPDGAGGALWLDFRTDAISHNGYRLSLATGNSTPSGDVIGASTLYLTPHTTTTIALFDGTLWRMRKSPEVSLSLASAGLTANRNYDVFAYWTGTALALELVAWATDSSRATAIVKPDGVPLKGTDLTRRYVGTVRTTGATTIEDSAAKRYVWNASNKEPRSVVSRETASSWAGVGAMVWRQSNGSPVNSFSYVTGDPALLEVDVMGEASYNTTGIPTVGVGVGIDGSAASSANVGGQLITANGMYTPLRASFRGALAAGLHTIYALEICSGPANTTFYGSSAGSGMVGKVLA